MATPGTQTEIFLTCTVCYDLCSELNTLTCGHSLCDACLKYKIATESSSKGAQGEGLAVAACPHCPTSKQTVEVTEGKSDVLVETMLVAAQDEGPVVCAVCNNKGEITHAVKWCQDCNEALCATCLDLHQKYPKFCHHKTTSLTESMKSNSFVRCTQHTDENLKLFCIDCDIAICHLCCSVSHRKCDSVVTLSEACLDMKKALSVKADNLQADLIRTRSLATEKIRQLKQLMESSDIAQAQLESNCNTFIQAVKDIQASLSNRIVRQTDAGARVLTQDIAGAESLCKTIVKDCYAIEHDVESGNMSTIYGLYQKFCYKDCPTDPAEVDEKEEKPRVIEVHFKSNIHEITQSLKQKYVGLVFNVFDKPKVPGIEKDTSEPATSQTPTGKEKKKKKKKLTKQTVPPATLDTGIVNTDSSENILPDTVDARLSSDSTSTTPSLEKTLAIKDENDAEDGLIADMITVPDADSCTIVVTDWPNNKVIAFYQKKNRKESIYCEHSPFGLTRVSDKEAAVVVKFANCIYLLQIHPTLEKLSTIATKRLYMHICHLGSLRFAVSDSGGNTIDIIDCTGNVLKQINNDKLSVSILYRVPQSGQFLVCDPESRSVTKLTANNKEMFRYHPASSRHLQKAYGLGTAKSGDIYVVDRGGSKVIKLSSDLKYLQNVLTFKDGGQVLAYAQVDDQNKLYLTYRDKEILVYQM